MFKPIPFLSKVHIWSLSLFALSSSIIHNIDSLLKNKWVHNEFKQRLMVHKLRTTYLNRLSVGHRVSKFHSRVQNLTVNVNSIKSIGLYGQRKKFTMCLKQTLVM